jgi:hypothetical protein
VWLSAKCKTSSSVSTDFSVMFRGLYLQIFLTEQDRTED